MMFFNANEVATTNSSYLQHKFNLTTNSLDYNHEDYKKTYQQEMFVIPQFTLVTAPLKNAQNTSYYYLEMRILGAYTTTLLFLRNGSNITFKIKQRNLIFQYDLNYSKDEKARGQIVISKEVSSSWRWRTLFTVFFDNDKKNLVATGEYHLNWATYKILLPAAAVKPYGLNILNYSFMAAHNERSGDKLAININSANNYGTLAFFLNPEPSISMQVTMTPFVEQNLVLTIKNPLILITNSEIISNDYFSKRYLMRFLTLNSKSYLDEVFTFTGSLTALQVQRRLQSYFPSTTNSYEDREVILRKLLIFHDNFNLAQKTVLNIRENNSKDYQSNKIPAFLQRTNSDDYQLWFNSVIYDQETKTVVPIASRQNEWHWPWFKAFALNINIPFIFETFFKYHINITFNISSKSAIIGNDDSQVTIKNLPAINSEVWQQQTTINLSYDDIITFYTSNNFTLADYYHLKAKTNNVY